MQLGTRWQVGQPPHASVPSALLPLIAAAEQQHPEASAWTLTWLEGRPRCALDDLLLVTLDGTESLGAVEDAHDEDDDDWLS
ncbi:Fe-S oxidoreductase [Leucobacter sp. OLJS4]|uniref:Fe-S oxidoreductase n=1 Tax=unclassified Leucobacter TaxID=2621730 RepID=UPI000C1A6748|nr:MULTISPECIES: Fe-S oxidoreductase [unclassified Leucobacter]PIJ50186.1 Fe-S oxidoreductase [Leucobacter sp. OLES1]PII81496.1 Fe-S oxidoreductase [Leucobacter sp. OLCALW19]PII86166.1 Fe-S oxidoreductase [Leucobacter sp. OLTLW20]PII90061.1 Fe-S oxidoreductase [Leucobacter sp. OLAS13]PII97094.1 Fe-S oxidoreductase [Leucobacter sp. OLDS2]